MDLPTIYYVKFFFHENLRGGRKHQKICWLDRLTAKNPTMNVFITSIIKNPNKIGFQVPFSYCPSVKHATKSSLLRKSSFTGGVSSSSCAHTNKRLFSSTSTGTKEIVKERRSLRILAKIVKIIRIPSLVIAIYGLGNAEGMLSHAAHKEKNEERVLKAILKLFNKDLADVQVLNEKSAFIPSVFFGSTTTTKTDQSLIRTSNVMQRIRRAGIQKSKEEMECAAKKLDETNVALGVSDEEKDYNISDDYKKWNEKKNYLGGSNWKYILIPHDEPMIFLGKGIPKTVFVTSELFEKKFEISDDDLALLLSYELSYAVLINEEREKLYERLGFNLLHLTFLVIDPTEGALSLLLMGLLEAVKAWFDNNAVDDEDYSTEDMALQIASMAEFDTLEASGFFQKLHLHHKTNNGGKNSDNTLSTTEKERARKALSVTASRRLHKDQYEYFAAKAKEHNESRKRPYFRWLNLF